MSMISRRESIAYGFASLASLGNTKKHRYKITTKYSRSKYVQWTATCEWKRNLITCCGYQTEAEAIKHVCDEMDWMRQHPLSLTKEASLSIMHDSNWNRRPDAQ